MLVASAVPEGAGVSSSAAVEVAAMQAVAAAHSIQLDGPRLALLCQKVDANASLPQPISLHHCSHLSQHNCVALVSGVAECISVSLQQRWTVHSQCPQ